MKKLEKIAGINLLIMLGYAMVVFALSGKDSHAGLVFSILYGLILAIHTFTLIVIAFVRVAGEKNTDAWAWLLSALIMLVIGFSSCYGGVFLL